MHTRKVTVAVIEAIVLVFAVVAVARGAVLTVTLCVRLCADLVDAATKLFNPGFWFKFFMMG